MPKGRKTPRPPKEPNPSAEIRVTTGSWDRVSFGVPNSVKIAIADALLAFAEMEAAVEVLIWELTGMSYDDGRLLTRMDAKMKFDLAEKLAKSHGVHTPPPPGKTTVWSAMTSLLQPRNTLVHGVWIMMDLITPAVISYRFPAAPEQIEAEVFDTERLEAVKRRSDLVRFNVDQMILKARALRATP